MTRYNSPTKRPKFLGNGSMFETAFRYTLHLYGFFFYLFGLTHRILIVSCVLRSVCVLSNKFAPLVIAPNLVSRKPQSVGQESGG